MKQVKHSFVALAALLLLFAMTSKGEEIPHQRKPISGMISSLFGGVKDVVMGNAMKEVDADERNLRQEKAQDPDLANSSSVVSMDSGDKKDPSLHQDLSDVRFALTVCC